MRKIHSLKLALALALFSFASLSASAVDVYVSAEGSDDADGTQANPVLTLGKAWQLINNATGTIYVSGEVDGYTLGGNSNADAVCPFLGNSFTLTIQGVEGTSPKITGNSTSRMFRLRSDMGLVLKNLTLSGTVDDPANREGCCVLMQGGWLETDRVVFENFSNNNNGTVLCVIGISAAKPSMVCKNTVFRNNSGGTSGYGSVMRVNDITVTAAKFYFENCAFLNNTALYGTFFFRQSTAVATNPAYTYVNCTFTGNSNSNGNSGCLTAYSAPITVNVINCTIKDNPANGSVRVTEAATVNIRNSILEGNGNDLNCEAGAKTPTLTVSNSLILAGRNIDAFYTKPVNYTSVDQLLNSFDAETNTFAPKFASLAIGYGDKQYLENLGADGATTINYDQLGATRSFADNRVDAGAVEAGESAVWVSSEGDDANSGTEDLPVLTLSKAFSFFAANQTGKIYVSGAVAAAAEGNGLALNGVNLTVQGVAETDAGIAGDSIRLFYLTNNAVLTLKDLHLSGNPAKSLVGQGGCAYINGGGGLFAENCTFENFSTAFNPANEETPNNDTSGAGVIFLNQFSASSANPALSFKNCRFKNNSTTGNWGGGVIRVQDFGTAAVINPKVYFENCGFYGNTSTRLGGSVIFIRAGSVAGSQIRFINSTVANCGTGGNGAVYLYGGTNLALDIINSTIKDNAVRGIYTAELTYPTLTIYNSVLEGNAGNDIYYQEKVAEPGTFNISNSLIDNAYWRNLEPTPYAKPVEYTAGTLFDDLDQATIAFTPKAGSLALNYGDPQYLTALNINYDQLGNERWFKNDRCDAGAIEAIRFPIFRGTGEWTETARWNTGAAPDTDAEVIIDGNATAGSHVTVAGVTVRAEKSLTVSAGKQLTVTQTLVVDGDLTLESDSDNGTATILTSEISGSGTAHVRQFLTGAAGASTRGWQYISSPVSEATSAVFDPVSTNNELSYYDETLTDYVPITDNATDLAVGKGYEAYLAGADSTYTFSGTLNNGEKTLSLTRTGTTAPRRGFNLVGNPYPSYLDWNAASKNNVRGTVWYRTYNGSQRVFDTYDGTVGTNNNGGGAVNQYIPPMQAFWARVDAAADNGSLVFDNTMRLHQPDNGPTADAEESALQILRLKVSNGVNSDETLLVKDENATDGFDATDAQKMSNNNALIPEIYTLAETEELVINHQNSIEQDDEIALGFRTGQHNAFTIQATEISGFGDLPVTLIDKTLNQEFELTAGEIYPFTSDVTDNADRFAIAFRDPQPQTGIETPGTGFYISSLNGQITVHGGAIRGKEVSVFNITGQKLCEETAASHSHTLSRQFPQGIYLVRTGSKTGTAIVK